MKSERLVPSLTPRSIRADDWRPRVPLLTLDLECERRVVSIPPVTAAGLMHLLTLGRQPKRGVFSDAVEANRAATVTYWTLMTRLGGGTKRCHLLAVRPRSPPAAKDLPPRLIFALLLFCQRWLEDSEWVVCVLGHSSARTLELILVKPPGILTCHDVDVCTPRRLIAGVRARLSDRPLLTKTKRS